MRKVYSHLARMYRLLALDNQILLSLLAATVARYYRMGVARVWEGGQLAHEPPAQCRKCQRVRTRVIRVRYYMRGDNGAVGIFSAGGTRVWD